MNSKCVGVESSTRYDLLLIAVIEIGIMFEQNSCHSEILRTPNSHFYTYVPTVLLGCESIVPFGNEKISLEQFKRLCLSTLMKQFSLIYH